ncbi:hypothetical protein HT031_000424 [Scenedesmus sp. PABB004]|nr:hypothetical protein HT031_000424 [Scenedesmus sp. PABB004]
MARVGGHAGSGLRGRAPAIGPARRASPARGAPPGQAPRPRAALARAPAPAGVAAAPGRAPAPAARPGGGGGVWSRGGAGGPPARGAAVVPSLERLYQLSPLQPLPSAAGGGGDEPAWRHGVFLVSVDDKPPTPTRSPQEKSPDYYANVGDAIRTLREDVPALFERELNYGIYREDIVFRDPRNSFAGMKNYKLIFWSLRFHGRIFFTRLYVEVRRIWQPSDGVISMRWTVHGIPRVPWEAEGIFDGISQYKLDGQGKIYEHAVDNVILRDPPMQGLGPLLAGLNLVPGAPQQPVPGAWFRGLEQERGAAAAAPVASRAALAGEGSSSSGGSGSSSGGGGGGGSSWGEGWLPAGLQAGPLAAEQLLPAPAALPVAADSG